MHRTLLFLAFAALAAGPLAAQHDHPAPAAAAPAHRPGMAGMGMGGMAGMDSMMAPLHAVMPYAPQRLLDAKTALNLNGEQESRLVRMAAAARPAHDSAHASAMQHRQALVSAMATTDQAGAIAHFQAAHAAMGDCHVAMLRSALEARALLTPSQRAQVDAAPPHRH
jgi:hypothetical protein